MKMKQIASLYMKYINPLIRVNAVYHIFVDMKGMTKKKKKEIIYCG